MTVHIDQMTTAVVQTPEHLSNAELDIEWCPFDINFCGGCNGIGYSNDDRYDKALRVTRSWTVFLIYLSHVREITLSTAGRLQLSWTLLPCPIGVINWRLRPQSF